MDKEITSSAQDLLSGRYEVTLQEFEKSSGGQGSILDLKEAMPEMFQDTSMIPRLVEKVWRRVVDDMIAESDGIYAYKGGTQIKIFFFGAPPAVSKAKIAFIRHRIPALLKDVQDGKINIDQAPEMEKKSRAFVMEQPRVMSDLERLMKNGLGDNPLVEHMDIWMPRVMQELLMNNQKMPLVKEMVDLAMKADVTFQALWIPSNQMVVGSSAIVKSALPTSQYKSGEVLRQDLAVLFSAVFQIHSMLLKGLQPLMMIPLRAGSLSNKNFSELYITLLRRLTPEARKNILLDIKSMPKDGASPSLRATIETISTFCRAIIFETGMLSYMDFRQAFPKLHAVGFDVSEQRLSEEELRSLFKKYVEHYSKAGLKTYIKAVENPRLVALAAEAAFTYISGPVIQPPQKTGVTVRKLALAEIK